MPRAETIYSPEVYIPDWFEMPTERVKLRYSAHALYACNNDRYGAIPVFETIPLSRFNLVELGVGFGKVNRFGIKAKRVVTKIVVRGKFDQDRDITFALIPSEQYYFVKTCWFNLSTDNHRTLMRKRYATV